MQQNHTHQVDTLLLHHQKNRHNLQYELIDIRYLSCKEYTHHHHHKEGLPRKDQYYIFPNQPFLQILCLKENEVLHWKYHHNSMTHLYNLRVIFEWDKNNRLRDH